MALDYEAMAKVIAAASKDPRYKVGAVIYDANGNIRSTGYNGAPRGIIDTPARYAKPAKDFFICHAEENAIVQAARIGVSVDDCAMLIWGKMPCATCARMIIQAGIKKVIFQRTDLATTRWAESFEATFTMLGEAGITIIYLVGEQ